MKGLTTLALLIGTLFVPALHAEESTAQGDATPPLTFPLSTTDAPATPDNTASDTPATENSPAAQPSQQTAAPATTTAPSATPQTQDVSDALPAMPPVTPAASGFMPPADSSLSFAQMGAAQGIALSGGQFQGGIDFTLPGDRVITSAQLALDVEVSPEMAARGTTLQLQLNGQSLGNVPLSASDNNVSHFELEIPAALMVSSNNLNFRVNDGDALLCLRDENEKSRVVIMPTSRFQLEGQQLDIGSDLSHFPKPFFDSQQMTPVNLTFSFPEKLTADTVSAAALVSSWMGMQADYRGISFDALSNRLPEQHGIVIGHPGERIGGLTLPQSNGPLLQIINNPVNPVYKLLLIVGKDDAALRAAAWRLTKGDFPGQMASADVEAQAIPTSKPYDAPRWIPTSRPVKLSELIRKDQSTTVSGVWHAPLQVAFRAAPDLYLWDGETIPLHIGYRFPSETWIDEEKSRLSVTLNNTFLSNLPMNKQGFLEMLWRKAGGDARQEKVTIPLEPYLIYGDNQLSLYFNVVPKQTAPCSVLLNNNIKSRLNDDSWIDLSHTQHFSMLPNLSYFVGASFPFTRLADYSQTVLLLPETPSETQVATLLNLAARSGNATGMPLANNRVVLGIPGGGTSLEYLRQRDVLAVGGLDQKAFIQGLLSQSPYIVGDNTLSVRPQTPWQKIQRWLLGDWSTDNIDADRYFSSNEAWRGFVSYRSPWDAERLVVAAVGSNDDQLARLPDDLSSSRINAGIRGDTSIITDENGVRSFRVSNQFPSGQMPGYMMAIWYANQYSALLAIVGLIAASILGVALTAMFRRHARKRLSSGSDNNDET
ncbi:cellulose synthase [Klebsiella sp. RIT-PI-d]|uniref:cellulose biosynthesis cyclic di-GMP-binding regulatory protein BcsB n=1 Tax=Klebsiella sp. RIT-PI-d TaxID=1681196 RepID=UPI000675EB7C|nr:cellulose biosynthesis cyclic di-GMP-binding regulatory protein BcsB [Klebsiella sp. RIT-PI-d]KNC11163.1 cellulose synthase [Klebsiella sp. RIT-PI-d]